MDIPFRDTTMESRLVVSNALGVFPVIFYLATMKGRSLQNFAIIYQQMFCSSNYLCYRNALESNVMSSNKKIVIMP